MFCSHNLLMAGLLLMAAASAEEGGMYDGLWRATFIGTSGSSLSAKVVLKGASGTWVTASDRAHIAGRFPCIGPQFPIVIQSSSADELKFEVDAKSAVKGCGRWEITANPADSKTLQGKFKDGRPITFVKQ